MRFNCLTCEFGNLHFQQRYVVCLLTFFAIVNCYNTRMCFNIAITEMVVETKSMSPDTCPDNAGNETIAITKGAKYNWTEMEQAAMLMAFYPGYLIMHVPGGYLSDMYGGRHVLSIGILLSGFLTLLTPLIINNLNYWGLVISRFLLGFAQGPLYPSITSLLAHWVPHTQRGRLGGMVYTGLLVGIVTGFLVSGIMMHHYGHWTIVFYVWGMACLIWYGCALVWCYSKPDDHPYITEKEKIMLDEEFGGELKRFKTPWKAILRDSSVWAVILAQCGHDWITYLVETCMPKYFKEVLKMSVTMNSVVTSVPFVLMWIFSIMSGYLGDYLVIKYGVSTVRMRVIYTTIASVGPSSFMLIVTYMGCNIPPAIASFWIGMTTMGPYYCGLKINVLDLSHHFSGILMSLANGIGTITGICIPYVVAIMAKNHTVKEWENVFWVTFILCTVTNIVYIVWASGERKEWDFAPEVIVNEE